MITRLSNTSPPINIINIYGRQESRYSKEDIIDSFNRLKKDIEFIEEKNEYVILIGDLNRQFGNDNYGIRGNKSKISFGGELYRSLLKTHKYVLVNNLEQTYGGPWTWINRQDPESKSCLDICIVSNSLVPFVDKVTIDKDRIFTPKRIKRIRNEIIETYTDHFSMKIELKNLKTSKSNSKEEPTWNVKKPEGWKIYQDISNRVSENIEEIIENENIPIDKVIYKIDSIDTKIEFI